MITWYQVNRGNTLPGFGFAIKNGFVVQWPDRSFEGYKSTSKEFRLYFTNNNISVVKIADQYEPGDKELLELQRVNTDN